MLEKLKRIDGEAWRDAARVALQGAVAAAATYLAMEALGLEDRFLGVLSAVFILHPSIGGTAQSARARLAATAAGTTVGLLALLALPPGVGTAAALAASVFLVTGMASLRPEWSYGIVAAVGLSLGGGESPLETAATSGLAIALGAAIGIAASLLVWPESARARFETHLSRALRAVRDRVDDAIATAEGDGDARANEIAPRYYGEMANAREALGHSRIAGPAADDRLNAIRRLYNATIIVDRADDALSGNRGLINDMDGPVREVRETIRAAIDRLLDPGADPGPLLEELDEALGRIAEMSVRGGSSPADSQARVALAFGLSELRASLGTLRDSVARARDRPPSRLPWRPALPIGGASKRRNSREQET